MNRKLKRSLALLMSLVMAFSLLSVSAWADEETEEEVAEILDVVDAEEEAAPAEEEAPAEEAAPAEEEAPAEEAAPAARSATPRSRAAASEEEEEAVLMGVVENQDNAVAQVSGTYYDNLPEAVAAALDGGEVKLLRDANGDGVKIPSGSNVTIDFGGHTYTVTGQLVGSKGTESQCFQLLKDSTVTMKNGAIRSTKALMIIQNYCNLTLDNMDLDLEGTNLVQYVVSNNYGSLTVTGNTTIKARNSNWYAFDLWYNMSSDYANGVSVTFDENFTGTVKGNVEYGRHNNAKDKDNWTEKVPFIIRAGTFEATLLSGNTSLDATVPDNARITISGGTFTKTEGWDRFLAEGYGFNAGGEVYELPDVVEFTSSGGTAQNLKTFPATLEAGTYKLLADVTLDAAVQVEGNVTLNLDGKNITSNVASGPAFQVKADNSTFNIESSSPASITAPTGRVIIIGGTGADKRRGTGITVNVQNNVTLTAGTDGVVAIYGEGGTVDSPASANNVFNLETGATLNGSTSFGIGLFGTGNTVNVSGTIRTSAKSYGISTNGNNRATVSVEKSSWSKNAVINIKSGADIDVGDEGVALYIPAGTVTIENGATVKGGNGILQKGGTITITGGTITGTKTPPAEYVANSNGFTDTTGEAIFVDNRSKDYHDGLGLTISGGTLVSQASVAVRSEATNPSADNPNRLTHFIDKGVTLKGALPTDIALLKANLRIDDNNVVVEAAGTIEEAASVTADADATYTVTPTGESAITVDVTGADAATDSSDTSKEAAVGEGNVSTGEIPVTSIDVASFLADALAKNELTAPDDGNAKVEFKMNAEVTNSASSPNSVSLNIHPQYTINGGTARDLNNRFIKSAFQVTLPAFAPGKTLKALYHWINGVKTAVAGASLSADGTLTFTSQSFSDWEAEFTPSSTDKTEWADASLAIQAVTKVGTGNEVKKLDGNAPAVGTDTATISIQARTTNDKSVTLSAYELDVVIPAGFKMDSEALPHYNTIGEGTKDSDGNTTYKFIYDAEQAGSSTTKYFNMNSSWGDLGTITVKATTSATYGETKYVKVSGKLGKTGVTGETNVEDTTGAPVKLMKTWTITFKNLGDGADKTVTEDIGHNLAVDANTIITQTGTGYNAAYMSSEVPVRAGYTFAGNWYSDEALNTQVDAVAPATAAATYYAKWNIVTYSIEYAEDHDSIKQTNFTSYTDEYDITTDLSILAPTKDGYTFAGWIITAQTGADPKNVKGGNWNDGVVETSEVVVGTPATTSISGAGYYGNVKLTANWTPKTYTIDYDDGAGTNDVGTWTEPTSKPTDYTIEELTAITAPTKTGYTFKGWTVTNGTGSWADTTDGSSISGTGHMGNVTLTAKWETNTYTIRYFDSATGIGTYTNPNNDGTYTIETNQNITAPTKAGYTFAGWTVSGGDVQWVDTTDGTAITGNGYAGNVTLTAKWTLNEYTATLTNSNTTGSGTVSFSNVKGADKDGNPTSIVTDAETDAITLKFTIESGINGDPSKDGYVFTGWKATDGGTSFLNSTYAKGTDFKGKYGNVTLEAQWVVDLEYVFVDYTYAHGNGTDTDSLMIVKWDGSGTLKFSEEALLWTDNSTYCEKFSTTDAPEKVYVTLVSKDVKDAAVADNNALFKVEDATGGNKKVGFTGDVIAADGSAIPDGSVTLADLSNTNDMLANNTLFGYTEISKESRLNADIRTDVKGTIEDLVDIISKMTGSTTSGG